MSAATNSADVGAPSDRDRIEMFRRAEEFHAHQIKAQRPQTTLEDMRAQTPQGEAQVDLQAAVNLAAAFQQPGAIARPGANPRGPVMNADEIKSLVTKLLLMLFTSLAAKYHIDGSTVYAVANDVASLGMLVYGVVAHWNMKKVPETAKVIGALLLAVLLAPLMLGQARAADMPVPGLGKAPAIAYPYDTSGVYFGIGSLVTGQKPTIDGATQAGVTSLGGSLGGLLGWRWGGKTGFAVSVDGAAYWNNLGGTASCTTAAGAASCSIESRFSAMQRVSLETDLALITQLFPTLNLPNAPGVPVLANIAVTGHKSKIFFALLEDDVSAQIAGLAIGKAWTFAPGVGVGIDWNLGNGSVVETWAAYFNPTQGFAIGPVPARASVGPIAKVGLNWKI